MAVPKRRSAAACPGLLWAGTGALAVISISLSSHGAAGARGSLDTERGERSNPAAGRTLTATIRRTTYGVPHIRARDFAGLGFGIGYAFAEDNICTIADRYVTVSAKRSRFFGPEGSWLFSGNNTTNNNLRSDFFYEAVNRSGIIEELIRSDPPHGPSRVVKRIVRGYAAGYNAYLRDTGAESIPDPRCRGAEWVRPIRPLDVYRHFYQLGSLPSAGVVIDEVASAEPVLGSEATAALAEQREAVRALAGGTFELDRLPLAAGSNAYGLGAEATRNGRGMLLSNTHLRWEGAERQYQLHLTIPGKLDVAGATFYGAPGVLWGHTDGLAWSLTVATAWRFTPFELTLAPGDPFSYVVDGEARPMEERPVSVRARTPDGDLETRTRTLYWTEYGPVFTGIEGVPFPWTQQKAYALGDVNATNFRFLNHFARVLRAQTVREYDRIQRRLQAIHTSNSIAADRGGVAYYSMDGAIPNVPDSKARSCAGSIGIPLFEATGIPVLDGSRSACAWDTDPDAVAPGIFGPSRLPRLFRRDYVHNGNDSHWLANPEHPLEGFERIIGDERTQRSLRTRIGLIMVRERLAGTDGLAGRRFDLPTLARVALRNRQYAGELWRDELVELCETAPWQLGSAGLEDVGPACRVLRRWNGRDELRSRGAILFRRFADNLLGNLETVPTGSAASQRPGDAIFFDRPFDATDPIDTPSGLNTANPLVGRALADAVRDLRDARIPLNAPLGHYQYEQRPGERIPLHGGPGRVGVFNSINVRWDPERGYPDVPHGSSFTAAVSFGGGRCPVRAWTFITYGQSENPQSPHATDYLRAFSRKEWNRVPYCGFQIRRDPNLTVTPVSGPIRPR